MASTNRAEGLSVIPAESTTDATELVEMYLEIERQLVPPQWMVDEAIARGDSWVTWNPPQNLVRERSRIFSAMHSHATVPVGEYLSSDDATTDGERKQLVYDYEYLMSKPMREIIQKEFDFKLKDLSIREQLYFLNYLKLTTVGEVEMMKRFTATHGVTGMRTFLALEKGSKDLGDMIVVFGQYEELSKKVFEYYSELLDIAETAEQLVKQKTDCEGEVCIQLATQVRENILNRAQKDLEAAVRANDLGEIEEKIGNYVAEAKEYVAVLQELGAQSTEKILASELSNDDKSKMLALLQQNYDNAYTYDVDFKEKIKQSLEKSFANPQTEFHILRDESKVISFNRFDVVTDNTGRTANYFGSFNADAAYAGVGSVMLERTIKEQLEKCDVMYAHCDPTSDIAKKYIESGFVAKETETVAGKFSLEIWRTKDIAEHLRSKQMSADVLLEKAGKIEKDYMLVREAMPDDMFEELDRDLGYLLTRYFKHDNKTYAVFEIPSPTLWNQFKA
jgi:hypothetical protein